MVRSPLAVLLRRRCCAPVCRRLARLGAAPALVVTCGRHAATATARRITALGRACASHNAGSRGCSYVCQRCRQALPCLVDQLLSCCWLLQLLHTRASRHDAATGTSVQ